MKIKFFAFTALLLLAAFFVWNKGVFAATRCETQYGGGQVCVNTGELQINKKVLNPSTNGFQDNLGLNEHNFAPNDEVKFRITIKNVGDATFSNVHVVDTLPPFLQLTSGDLTFDIKDLGAGQSVDRDIVAKVVPADQFPSDLTCKENVAEGWSDNNTHDKDTAQVCIQKAAQKPVLGVVKAIPVTGPENWLLLLSIPLLTSLAGFVLLKLNHKLSH